MSHEPRIREISDGRKRVGYHSFHLPLRILAAAAAEEEDDDGKVSRRRHCIRRGKFAFLPSEREGRHFPRDDHDRPAG
jgi:hypothetical protein